MSYMTSGVATRLLRVVVLTVVWVTLWSDVTIANTASGLLVAWLVVSLFDRRHAGGVTLRPIRLLHLAGHFAMALVGSTIEVARAVITPRNRIQPGILAVPLSGCSDTVATLIGDMISLTPGTLTLEMRRDPLVLYVHALDTRDMDRIRHDIRRLEVLAVRALGSTADIAALASAPDDRVSSGDGSQGSDGSST